MRTGRLLVLVACGGVAVTCADPTGPDGAMGLALALNQIAGVEDYLAAGTSKGGAVEALAPGSIPSGCDYDFASGAHVCPASTQNGIGTDLTVNRSYKLLDADGDPRAIFDAKLVTEVQVTTIATGTYSNTLPASNVTFTTTIDDTLRISGGARVLNGSAVTSATAVINGKTKTTQATQIITDLAPPVTSSQVLVSGGLPLSGSVTSIITGTDTTGAALASATITTTFNGTPTYTTTVQKSGASTTYKCTYSKGNFNQVFVSCTIAP